MLPSMLLDNNNLHDLLPRAAQAAFRDGGGGDVACRRQKRYNITAASCQAPRRRLPAGSDDYVVQQDMSGTRRPDDGGCHGAILILFAGC